VIITENELRKVIRQIILEEHRLNEGPIWDKIKSMSKKGVTVATLIAAILSGPSTAGAETTTSDLFKLKAAISDVMQKDGASGHQFDALTDTFNQLMRDQGHGLTTNKIMQICMDSGLNGKYFGALERGLSSSGNGDDSFPFEIKNKNLEVKVINGFYYSYDKEYKFYFKVSKEDFDSYSKLGVESAMTDDETAFKKALIFSDIIEKPNWMGSLNAMLSAFGAFKAAAKKGVQDKYASVFNAN
jgi:hypothetical protein